MTGSHDRGGSPGGGGFLAGPGAALNKGAQGPAIDFQGFGGHILKIRDGEMVFKRYAGGAKGRPRAGKKMHHAGQQGPRAPENTGRWLAVSKCGSGA